MPGMDGVETARRLAEVAPAAVVVLISVEPVPELPSSIESVGAAAYVRKQELNPGRLRQLWKEHRPRQG
jgi:DNA-binding NarL/FixJ family response regulator